MGRWLPRWVTRATLGGNTNDAARRWKRLTVGSIVVLALVAATVPVRGASDNTNLIQQILVIVQSIQSVIVGTDVSVASLQSQIAAIKAKTDKLPADTATTLNQIKTNVGSGPLTQMLTKFVYNTANTSILCTSSGPFLLHVRGNSDDGVIGAGMDLVPVYYENTKEESGFRNQDSGLG